ncbi:hypothetical protein V6N11_064440 [Hibiscus sabdariffa]|uniref:Uncharacterized protein n=2 Tax=Hibiscus sabdariffa TaxID=183260 RepID=A0ABR2P8W6_9ROSI
MDKKKLFVWVSPEGIPLLAWSDSGFSSIVNKWGYIIKIGEDTSKRNCFDCARILLRVTFVSMIPSSVLVKLNGLTIGLSCRFEDADNCDNVGAVGDVPNLVENVVGSHANEHMEVDTNLNDHANLNLGSNDPQSVIENDSVGLVDIHVAHSIELAQVAESSKSSSGFRDGSLDPKKIIEAPEASEYRPKEHVGTLVEILASSKCVDVPDSNKSGEARLTIEVCNSLGLFFDAMIWRFARG